MDNDYRFRVDL